MGQEAGEKWAAAVDLQPTIPKSDRLPGAITSRACLRVYLPGDRRAAHTVHAAPLDSAATVLTNIAMG